MDDIALDLRDLSPKGKNIILPSGKTIELAPADVLQAMGLASFVNKFEYIKDLNNKELKDKVTIEEADAIFTELKNRLEDIVPELKGERLSMQGMFKLLQYILQDVAPANRVQVSPDTGDAQKKIDSTSDVQ